MPIDQSAREQPRSKDFNSLEDASLVGLLAQGDEAALRVLMDRFDKLVRYTVFRTAREQSLRDPQWLDAVAGDSWSGFLKSVRRGSELRSASVGGYLAGIARQQTLSALRRLRAFAGHRKSISEDYLTELATTQADPAAIMDELDSLTALRECAALLAEEDRLMMTQLQAITQRRWVEAGAALGLSESTLRSRWAKVVERLRICMEKKNQ